MHDRFLACRSHEQRTPMECYHWAVALRLFNHELSGENFQTRNRDAIWMAAALISWMVLYAVETQDPEEVWPLSHPTSSDIPWFPIQKSLRTLWEMVQPHRPDSLFAMNALEPSERCLGIPPPASGIDGIPQPLVDMCELDKLSNARNNPYHTAVRTLSDLINYPGAPRSIKFLSFLNTTEPEFEDLLSRRDPRSLLLVALWYGIVPESAWWISLRAKLERKAICIYLNRYHATDPLIYPVLASIQTTV